MTPPRQIIERLALQRAYPDCYEPCTACRGGEHCHHCLGTRKVTKPTAREQGGAPRPREYA